MPGHAGIAGCCLQAGRASREVVCGAGLQAGQLDVVEGARDVGLLRVDLLIRTRLAIGLCCVLPALRTVQHLLACAASALTCT